MSDPPPVPDPVAGQKLAAELRYLQPDEPVQLSGVIKIKRGGQGATATPFVFRITPGATSWTATYETAVAATNATFEKLTIEHRPGQTNTYQYITTSEAKGQWSWQTNIVHNPTNCFARSDFALGDLGLEFLHWSDQRLRKKEMRSSRFCRVLESRPGPQDRTLDYARVVSWVDHETGNIIHAEAYDNGGRLLKEFEINSVKKVAGRYQLQEMEIRQVQGKSRTRLTFDGEKK